MTKQRRRSRSQLVNARKGRGKTYLARRVRYDLFLVELTSTLTNTSETLLRPSAIDIQLKILSIPQRLPCPDLSVTVPLPS